MAKHILKCTKCKKYTMQELCPSCGGNAANPAPPKYSPEDPYGTYRRKARREILEKEGKL
ncbi:RNA-protein complex protein Nop10 [Candidatus Woesearchaeota archaeon]|mgnify:CR=1 FL=1|nr:RNA-protein complex protein Nop10 [Candidatus Woesearchaeota archaeon]MBT7366991.1 RNA-protein complex protein Nop10 [Candidatus Woesearchaeota archaeon]